MDRDQIALSRERLRMDRAEDVGSQARLSGRVSRSRALPRVVFAEMLVNGRLAQIAARAVEEPEAFALLTQARSGDWIEAVGEWGATRSGDRALFCQSARTLASCPASFPAWFDPMGGQALAQSPDLALASDPERMRRVRHRFELFSRVRRELEGWGFMEVATPILGPGASGAAATPFVTRCEALGEMASLRVAPESQLVRLLASGFERVFEMGPSFRNEGLSARHNPEFWLMEAYAVDQGMEEAMGWCERLCALAYQSAGRSWVSAERWGIERALAEAGGLSAEQAADEGFLSRSIEQRGGRPEGSLLTLQWQWFDLIEQLPRQPFFVMGHPVEISPLAAADPRDPARALRFELYAEGMELGNGYEQLSDAVEQAERFARQAERQGRGMEAMSADAAYARALEMGLPRVGGFGLGLDRLAQASFGARSLREMLPFPMTRGAVEGPA